MSILSWLKRPRLDDEDLQDEIHAHLAIAADERMADGADRRSAQLESLKAFGNVALTKEAARRVWIPWWLEALHDQLSDVRYAIRALAKNPVFSLTVVGVLTLGIGLNAAVFTMIKGLALTPLGGVEGSARLRVMFRETSTGRQIMLSYPDYQYLRDHDRAFSGLFGSSFVQGTLGRGRSARQVSGELVTGNYFQLLGVRAELGRTLLPSDEIAPGRHPVVVLGDGLWRREFAADPSVVGQTVEINNYPLTVVGVAHPTFHGTLVSYDTEVYIPVMMAPQMGVGGSAAAAANVLTDRRASVLLPQGFPRPGVTLANATAQTDALWATLAPERPLSDATQRLRVVPFSQSPNGAQTHILPVVIVLSAMGLLVLLIACANIAGLVLVRGVSRRGEIAVRLALGATRTRIVRLLVVENLVLALPGAALGVLLASRGIPVLVRYAEELAAPQRLFFNIEVDGLVIGFAALVACLCAVVFGFVPALRSSRIDLVSAINEDASPRGATRGRLRAGLVVAQVAVSLLLLVGAGLVTRSLEAARRAYPGFDANHVATLELDVKQNGYDERARPRVLSPPAGRGARRSRHRISHARGVHAAGVSRYALAPRGDRGLRTASRRRSGLHVQRRRLGLLSDPADPAGRRTRVRRSRRRDGRTGGDREPDARAAILGRRGERDWQAGPRHRRRLAHGDRRRGGCEVHTDRRAAAPLLLSAIPAVVPVEHDPAHPRPGARRRPRGPGARAGRRARRRSADCVTPGRWPTG